METGIVSLETVRIDRSTYTEGVSERGFTARLEGEEGESSFGSKEGLMQTSASELNPRTSVASNLPWHRRQARSKASLGAG
jgi:hypothetical protein